MEEEGDEYEEDLLQISEISINLSTYNDIFSKFDPRPYTQRALSDDLLVELKKASVVKTAGNLEVRFSIPKKLKNSEEESVIKRRLKEYFKRHHEITHKEIKRTQKKGLKFVIIGSLMIFIVALIKTYLESPGQSMGMVFLKDLIVVALEPAGWFVSWSGLEKLLITPEKWADEISFFNKMTNAEFHFIGY